MARRIRRTGVFPGDGESSIDLPPFITSKKLLTSSVEEDSFTVEFTRATDDVTVPEDLVYTLYKSASANLSTVEDILSNGSLVDSITGQDKSSYSITVGGLSLDETVYFNIIVEDEAGNQNAYTQSYETTIAVDTSRPVPTISVPTGDPTNVSPITVSISFTEDVTGLAVGDIASTNSTLANLVNLNGHDYTVQLTPSNDGIVTIQLPANAATDDNGNLSVASNIISFVFDGTNPVPAITSTSTSPTADNPIPITIDFGEVVTGFEVGDINASGASIGNFVSVDGQAYTADVIPDSAVESITIDIAGGVATDDAGNSNNPASQFAIEYAADSGPDVTVTSSESDHTATSPIPITITFTQDVTGFTAGGIAAIGATVSNFQASSASVYTADLVPSSDPINVTARVSAGVCENSSGSPNKASNTFAITYDTGVPQGVISSTEDNPTNTSPIPHTVDFEIEVVGLSASDIIISGGTISNFVNVDGITYTFDVTPDSDNSTISTRVPADVCQSLSGIDNRNGNTFQIEYDIVGPIPVISSDESSPTTESPIPVEINFDEDVTGFTVGDLIIGNGSASNFTSVSASSYTVDITPDGAGTITIDIASGACEDGLSNSSQDADQFVIVYDNAAPSVSSSTLSFANITETAATVNFIKASDNFTPQSQLHYTLYKSDTNNIDTVSNIEDNGQSVATGIDVNSFDVSGYSSGQAVWFNIIVQDGAGNKAAYTQKELIFDDDTAPTVGSPLLGASDISTSGFSVGFARAEDNATPQANLEYYLYTSTTSNLTTDADTVETNGTLADSGTDKINMIVTGLDPNTQYYFNVVVEDANGNKSIYTQSSITTLDTAPIKATDFGISEIFPGGNIDFALVPMSQPDQGDVDPPVISDGTLTFSNITQTSADLNIVAATDDSDILYILYESTTNNIGTVEDAEANGSVRGQGNATSFGILNLDPGTTYWFNVIAQDENGNKSAYTQGSFNTDSASTGIDSRAGDEAALEDIDASVNGLPSGWSSNISLSSPPTGVTVDTIGGELRVTEINLRSQGLTGSIDNASLSNLKKMTLFAIYYNSLNTPFPSGLMEITNLEYCYLCMTGNNEGEMGSRHPHEWLADDGINQEIHVGKGKGSENNVITGTIPAPSNPSAMSLKWFICNWTDSTPTAKDGIQEIEPGFFNISTFVGLQIYDNTGISLMNWPSAIGDMHDLFNLYLGCSSSDEQGFLTGTVPGNLENLTQLRFAGLERNYDLIVDFDVTDFRQFNLRNIEITFTDVRGTFPAYMTDGSIQSLVFLNFANPTGPGMTGIVTGPASEDDETLQGCMLTGHDLSAIDPKFWNHIDLINQNFAHNPQLTTIGTDDLTHLGTQYWTIRNLRWYNCSVQGRWPNLAWGTDQLEDLSRFQVHGNQYNFEDILWRPNEFNPSNKTIYQLYVDHGNARGGWNRFDVGAQEGRGGNAGYTISAGSNITLDDFDTEFTHSNNNYQWEKDGSNISGATSRTLVISNADSGDDGEYQLKVTNPGAPQVGTIRSGKITIEVE